LRTIQRIYQYPMTDEEFQDPFYDHLLSDDSDASGTSDFPPPPQQTAYQSELQQKDSQIQALQSELFYMTQQLQDQSFFVSQTLTRVNQILQHFSTLRTSVQDLQKMSEQHQQDQPLEKPKVLLWSKQLFP